MDRNDLKIVQNFKKMCKNLLILNFPNEGDDLIFETFVSNEHLGAILKIKQGEKLYKYCSESFNKAECNYHTMEKEILAIIRGMEKFLIFLAQNFFSFELIAKEYFINGHWIFQHLSSMLGIN